MNRDSSGYLQLVLDSIVEFNADRTPEERLHPDAATVLYGAGSALNSLDLVTLIIRVEERMATQLGIADISLADERAFSSSHSPFHTVASLASYLNQRISERRDG